MAAAYRPGASSNALYAAALFASENGGWQQAQTLLGRIPAASQTSQMRDLRQRVNYNLQLTTAQDYLARGQYGGGVQYPESDVGHAAKITG